MKSNVTKIFIFSCIVLLAVMALLMYIYRPSDTGKTVHEAVQKTGRTVIRTVHEEKVEGGEIIFFIKNSTDYSKADLAAGYVKKSIFGWKWIYGGEHGSIKSSCSKNGFSAQFFPSVDKTPFPIYFGSIINNKIEKIELIELQRNIVKAAKIFGNGDLRVWYVPIDDLKGSKFIVKAYSKDGNELSNLDEDIYPYSADQKPMKQESAKEFLEKKFGKDY